MLCPVVELNEDGCVVGGFFFAARGFIDDAELEATAEVRRQEEVVDADAAVVLEGVAEVVPVGELAGFAGVQGAEGVGVAEVEEGAEAGARLGLKEGVADPVGRFVAVDVLGDDVEVAADDGRCLVDEPLAHLSRESVHPVELVEEFVGADGVSVGEIDVDDAEAAELGFDAGFEEARVTVGGVSGEGCAEGFDGETGEDGDAVVGFLRDGGGVVAEFLEAIGGEVGSLELLEEEDVGFLLVEPAQDVIDPGADGVYVPGGDPDGEGSFGVMSQEYSGAGGGGSASFRRRQNRRSLHCADGKIVCSGRR